MAEQGALGFCLEESSRSDCTRALTECCNPLSSRHNDIWIFCAADDIQCAGNGGHVLAGAGDLLAWGGRKRCVCSIMRQRCLTVLAKDVRVGQTNASMHRHEEVYVLMILGILLEGPARVGRANAVVRSREVQWMSGACGTIDYVCCKQLWQAVLSMFKL